MGLLRLGDQTSKLQRDKRWGVPWPKAIVGITSALACTSHLIPMPLLRDPISINQRVAKAISKRISSWCEPHAPPTAIDHIQEMSLEMWLGGAWGRAPSGGTTGRSAEGIPLTPLPR